LKEFSFGFILRDTMPINEVSTPTKFSTYVGAGVIPIITDSTPALAAMASHSPFHITAAAPGDAAAIAEDIMHISSHAPTPAAVASSFQQIFKNYFDDSSHRRKIAEKVSSLAIDDHKDK
jgi:cytochrome c551/c552